MIVSRYRKYDYHLFVYYRGVWKFDRMVKKEQNVVKRQDGTKYGPKNEFGRPSVHYIPIANPLAAAKTMTAATSVDIPICGTPKPAAALAV